MGSGKKISQTRGASRAWGGERMSSGCLVSQTQDVWVPCVIFLLVQVSTHSLDYLRKDRRMRHRDTGRSRKFLRATAGCFEQTVYELQCDV